MADSLFQQSVSLLRNRFHGFEVMQAFFESGAAFWQFFGTH